MEKYAKLMKGLEVCAGPECCKDGCPYYGETRGGKTCRAWLLNDAAAAIANELGCAADAVEAMDDLEAECNALRTERDGLRKATERRDKQLLEMRELLNRKNDKIHELLAERDKLLLNVDDLEAANNTYRTERDKLAADNMELRKTDRPSACDKELVEEVGKLIAQAKYQEGKADALEWFLREWFREGGFQE